MDRPAPKNIDTAAALRRDLARAYEELRAGTLETSEAAELANLAGKIISTAKTQVAYYALRKDIPYIKFLEDDTAAAAQE